MAHKILVAHWNSGQIWETSETSHDILMVGFVTAKSARLSIPDKTFAAFPLVVLLFDL